MREPEPVSELATGLHQATDADLLAGAARRDQHDYAILVSRHFTMVHRVVWRMTNGHADAEDVTQEAFLRLWKNPAQVRDAAALKGWLMRVATNLVMDRYRSKPTQELEEADAVADDRPNAEHTIDKSRATQLVDRAVASLPDRQKLALTLVHFEHQTNIAAAAVMEVSVDALESLLARARRTLKDRLAADKELLLATLASERT